MKYNVLVLRLQITTYKDELKQKTKKKKKKNEWVGICYVKLEDKRENT